MTTTGKGTGAGRSPYARKNLGHTESLTFKLHPDLMAYLRRQGERFYCSPAEYMRRLIIADSHRTDIEGAPTD